MLERFHFYRHRRFLPFAAAYALVFINGATLAPFVPPLPFATSWAASDDAAQADAWQWSQYERDTADEQEPCVSAAPPPLVKNLRRAAPSRHAGCCGRRPFGRPDDVRGQSLEFRQRVLVANAADLSRLCRLLL